MTLTISPYLHRVFLADAAVSGAAAVLMVGGAGILGPFLALPTALLFWAGLALVPFVALLFVVARRETAPRLLVLDIVVVNALWVAASFGILLSGLVTPNLPGTLFVVVQALTVALLAVLQLAGMRDARAAA